MMYRFILAPDSFKGTMDAQTICAIWAQAIQNRIPQAQCRAFPLADGGEGMVQAYLSLCGGQEGRASVQGPFGVPVEAQYGLLPGGRAVLEMAACAGLPLVGQQRDPERASTYGLGELLRHMASMGVQEVLLGLGGSATNDCGIGMAAALGYGFLDEQGRALEPLAANMGRIAHIRPPEQPLELRVTAACDVDNPLLGPQGATYTFGPQKGAEGPQLERLEAGMANMARLLQAELGADVAALPGAGAAGGLGAGVVAFLGGKLAPGVDLLLDTIGFDRALEDADLVFTGEGRLDWQSARGKLPVGVARCCQRAGVPCIALCGSLGPGAEETYALGITAAFASISQAGDMEQVRKTCKADMARLMDGVISLLLLGEKEASRPLP